METGLVLKKVKHLEEELNNLKTISSNKSPEKKIISLKNTLKGLKVTEKDLKEAKKSLFPLSS